MPVTSEATPLKLVVVSQTAFAGYALPARGAIVLGRSEKSDVRIDDPSINRKHAKLVAERVHEQSRRRGGPFLRLNCAAVAESLLEAELFGYERGAFTGAAQAKPGLLEVANGGTFFIDEVGEMPLALQAKMLRALESQQVMRVGALGPRTIDVRFVAATNRDLEDLVREGRFREDLYFRLNGAHVVVPPLRERASEIALLAAAFIRATCDDLGRRPALTLRPEALSMLQRYAWPGNVREPEKADDTTVESPGTGVATVSDAHAPLRRRGLSAVRVASVVAALTLLVTSFLVRQSPRRFVRAGSERGAGGRSDGAAFARGAGGVGDGVLRARRSTPYRHAPCNPGDVSGARNQILAGDILGFVALAAAGVATWLIVTRPAEPATTTK